MLTWQDRALGFLHLPNCCQRSYNLAIWLSTESGNKMWYIFLSSKWFYSRLLSWASNKQQTCSALTVPPEVRLETKRSTGKKFREAICFLLFLFWSPQRRSDDEAMWIWRKTPRLFLLDFRSQPPFYSQQSWSVWSIGMNFCSIASPLYVPLTVSDFRPCKVFEFQ